MKGLGLPVRVLNALISGGVRTLEELEAVRSLPSRQIRGIGAIGWVLIDQALASYEPTIVAKTPEASVAQLVTRHGAESSGTSELPAQRFKDALDASLGGLSSRDRAVFFLRTGRDGPIPTLDDVGAKFGVTRERARQVWQRALDRFATTPWMVRTLAKLKILLDDDQEPLYLDLLGALDPWFTGFEHELNYLGNVVEAVSDGAVLALDLRGRLVFSRMSPAQWDDLIRTALDTLRTQSSSRLSQSDVGVTLEALASKAGVRALLGEVHAELDDRLHFAVDATTGQEYLSSIGQTSRSIVADVLSRAAAPMPIAAILDEYTALTGSTVTLTGLRAAIGHAGGFPFSGRRYGLKAHLGLTPSEQQELLAIAEVFVEGSEASRQWHTREIADEVIRQRPEWEDDVDPYVVDIILHSSATLDDLGRQTWRLRDGSARTTEDRLGIADLCIDLLTKAGRPMSHDELRAEVSKHRGLAVHLHLSPNARMFRLEKARWGLIERDSGLTLSQRDEFLSRLEEYLRTSGQGIHYSEMQDLREILGDVPLDLGWGLAEQNQRFRIGRGQYLGLATWSTMNRLTVREAVEGALLPRTERLSITPFLARVEELLGRAAPTESVRGALRERGYYHDSASGEWVMSLDLST